MRTKIEWRSASKDNYLKFCKEYSSIKLTFDEWRNIIYSFNESFKEHILETGDKIKLPFGFGEFSINKKKRRRLKNSVDGKEFACPGYLEQQVLQLTSQKLLTTYFQIKTDMTEDGIDGQAPILNLFIYSIIN